MSLISEFNEIAVLAGVPEIKPRKRLAVLDRSETSPITVWRQVPATELHQGTNEDGFRWTAVHNGIPHRPTYKPF